MGIKVSSGMDFSDYFGSSCGSCFASTDITDDIYRCDLCNFDLCQQCYANKASLIAEESYRGHCDSDLTPWCAADLAKPIIDAMGLDPSAFDLNDHMPEIVINLQSLTRLNGCMQG